MVTKETDKQRHTYKNRLWNSLADDLKDSSSLLTFKKHIISNFYISCVPPYYIMGNRYSSVIHARLRNNCSSLYNDLFRNHVRHNPLCEWCGVMEDATHFFFHCIKYIGERQVFNDTVREFQPLTTNLILFGSENWNIETNMVLFRAIHRYIHASKRF